MAEKMKQQGKMKFLNGELEAVRKLPDVYIGALGNLGFKNMYREIVQNSLDNIIKGEAIDKNIIVSIDMRNYTCIVEDNGQGIALDILEKVFSKLHSSTNYDKEAGSGQYSAGKNGMGATITNFLSKFFYVESYRLDGTAGKVEFSEGVVSKPTRNIKPIPNKHGLITTFAPSDMMGNITVSEEELYELTWMMVHLCKIGTKVIFNSINTLGQKHRNVIENKSGIHEMIDRICEKSVINPIYFIQDNGTMKVEILFSYDIKNMDDPNILGFANMCPANGKHIDGFLDGVIKFFRDYMNKIYLANNKKLTVNAQDIKTGLRGIVSCYHTSPLFTGRILPIHYSNIVSKFF